MKNENVKIIDYNSTIDNKSVSRFTPAYEYVTKHHSTFYYYCS